MKLLILRGVLTLSVPEPAKKTMRRQLHSAENAEEGC